MNPLEFLIGIHGSDDSERHRLADRLAVTPWNGRRIIQHAPVRSIVIEAGVERHVRDTSPSISTVSLPYADSGATDPKPQARWVRFRTNAGEPAQDEPGDVRTARRPIAPLPQQLGDGAPDAIA